jgi:hypothetical protein
MMNCAARIEVFGPHWGFLDGGFMPKISDPPCQVNCGHSKPEHKLKGEWTYWSVKDNSIDTRPGSHSTFLLEGVHSQGKLLMEVNEKFERVWMRVARHLALQGLEGFVPP